MARENIQIVVTESGSKVVKRNIEDIGKGAKTSATALDFLKRALLLLGGTLIIRKIISLSDTFTVLQTNIQNVTKTSNEYNYVFAKLFKIAQETGAELPGLASGYLKLNVSLTESVKQSVDLVKVSELLARGFAVSNTAANTAAGATLQLTQGLATNFKSAGQELNSIIEGAPLLAKIIAVQLGGQGATDLKKFAEEGKLTAKVFLDAIIASEDAIKSFAIPPTIDRSLQRITNAFLVYVNLSSSFRSASTAVASALDYVALNINKVARVLTEVLVAVAIPAAIAALRKLYMVLLANPFFAIYAGLNALIQIFGGVETVTLNLSITFKALVTGWLLLFNKLGSEIQGFGNGVVAVFTKINTLFKTFKMGLDNFLDDPMAEGNFAAFEYNLQKGVSGAFKEAYNKVKVDAKIEAGDLIDTLGDEVRKAAARKAELRQGFGIDIPTLDSMNSTPYQEPNNPSEEVLKRQEELLKNIHGPMEDYKNAQRDLKDLLNQGRITIQEYNQELANQEQTFLEAFQPTNFSEGFITQLRIMQLETRNTAADMGKSFAEVFGPNGDLHKGISSAISGSIIYGRSWKESIYQVAQSISEKLLTQLIEVGLQLIFNTQQQQMFNAMSGGGGGGGLFGSILGAVAGSFTGGFGAQGGLSRQLATGSSSFIGPMQSFGGFSSGGYTGDMGRSQVAGAVHGQEFVINADATRRNRPMLEAMNQGKNIGGGGVNVKVDIINQAAGVEHEVNHTDDGRIEIIARRVVREEAPKVVANEINDSNSRTSKALNNNLNAQRRR